MGEQERDAVLALCLLAALADGERTPAEQEQLLRIASGLGGADLAGLVERVQAGQFGAADAAARLTDPASRRTAYELAVTVVYADGMANGRERTFLSSLERALAQGDGPALALEEEAQALAASPVGGPTPSSAVPAPASPRPSQAGIPAVSHDEALQALIRQQALLAGALELLPQNLATLAIIPVQMRLVYRIGADYGQKLDAAQIRDLLGVLGIGAAGQVLDGVARRLLGGAGRAVLGRVLGGVAGGAAGLAAGAGLAFATTYALGHAARQYYAQGRRLSREDLRALFDRFRAEAEALLPSLREEIQAQSRQLDLGRLLGTLRGSPAR